LRIIFHSSAAAGPAGPVAESHHRLLWLGLANPVTSEVYSCQTGGVLLSLRFGNVLPAVSACIWPRKEAIASGCHVSEFPNPSLDT
jgi:hypothetical protein